MNKQIAPVMKPMVSEMESQISHIADFYNRYPGEIVHFSTLLRSQEACHGLRLSIFIPGGCELVNYTINHPEMVQTSYTRAAEGGVILDWLLADISEPGTELEMSTEARILPTGQEEHLSSSAELRDAEGYILSSERVQVFVKPQSSYMRFLPEIYSENDFLGRFLMLFESFWRPADLQIAQGEFYYDMDLTPEPFLPWLASWIGVTWDDHLSDDRKRQLLHTALAIYQRRGTRLALQDFLKIYTGGQVEIIEHRTQNFVLGSHSYLGHTNALGKHNFPHTFTVNLKVHSEDIFTNPGTEPDQLVHFYRQIIENLIETQKPAHTAFKLNLEVIETEPSIQG
jgi:phage tail-like protein